jgi:hypothetical protein
MVCANSGSGILVRHMNAAPATEIFRTLMSEARPYAIRYALHISLLPTLEYSESEPLNFRTSSLFPSLLLLMFFTPGARSHAMPQNPALKGILLAKHARSTLYS